MRSSLYRLPVITPQIGCDLYTGAGVAAVDETPTYRTESGGALVRLASGAQAEVCDGDGPWQLVMDCSTVSSPECAEWACCVGFADDAGPLHTCLPAQECEGGDGGER